ncbi:MAG TPA: IclR family transcriptional regulator C-terminal domain-containing protein, partial [Trebonia sp.]|nr:IclR family transcriptional regulator C-terminal domain-containing protein [Trebonia sp.]
LLTALTALAGETGERAYLCAWRHGDISILASRQGTLAVRVAELNVGYYDKAHARASGKVLLAFAEPQNRAVYLADHPLHAVTARTIVDSRRFAEVLETVRLQGFATEVEEFVEGVACLAVPIMVGDRLIAAYTISAPAARLHDNFDAYLDSLGRAASAATAAVLGQAPDLPSLNSAQPE